MSATFHNRVIESPTGMSPYQIIMVALCCLINIADGFDVVSLAVAAPVLTKEWKLDPALLGSMFSIAALGLAIGAFVIGPLADRFGRRPIMLTALGALAAMLLLSGMATQIWQLFAARLVTGVALGTLVVCLNTTVAEYSSDKARNLALAIMHIGFSCGMMLGSAIAAVALNVGSWRMIFFSAGLLNLITFVLGTFLIGESREFLARRQASGDLARLNRLNRRMRIPEFSAMPSKPDTGKPEAALRTMLSSAMRTPTLLVWTVSATYAIVGYFLLNWQPTILAGAGFTPSTAAAVGIVTGACGIIGHLSVGMLGRAVGEWRLTTIFLAAAAVTLVLFGWAPSSPVLLVGIAAATNFFVIGAYTGIFLVAVSMYPPRIQNAGVGFVAGFQRIGAMIGPAIGGFLLSAGLSRTDTYFIFSGIAIIPALAMYLAYRLATSESRRKGYARPAQPV